MACSRIAALAALFLMLLPGEPAAAATCSNSVYRSVISAAATFESSRRGCERAFKRSAKNIGKICSACRSTVISGSTLVRLALKHKSCLGLRSRRQIAEARQAQEALRFMRRGCGY